MSFLKSLSISISLVLSLIFSLTHAATFEIRNNCPYTVWAAAVPGGGMPLNNGQTWVLTVPDGTQGGRIWARTSCNFDQLGQGQCLSGDCSGLLACQGYGTPPNTLAEYALNQFSNLDFFDISLVDGFNVPMDFSPTSGCGQRIECADDIIGQCPNELRVPGGCNNPCTTFKTNEYCCPTVANCSKTDFSRFFKGMCPTAVSYPLDNQVSTFTCPGGTNYRVVFCP